jgi:hypothetical protein
MRLVGPRLYGIPAGDADVVAVIRRGPSDWCAVGRWDVAGGTYDHGAWLRGRLYPERCDVSPDGRWLCYFAHHPSATWDLGWTYVALSRLPWLHALAAWRTNGTWTRGAHFVPDAAVRELGPPDHGTVPYELLDAGLAVARASSYAVERRRDWSESPGAAVRAADDLWDERRAKTLRMTKPRPGDDAVRLEVSGGFAAFRSGGYSHDLAYEVVEAGESRPLSGVQWADWARDGRLLVATDEGRLETRSGRWLESDAVVADLAGAEPAPREAPPVARRWR